VDYIQPHMLLVDTDKQRNTKIFIREK